MSLWNEFHPSTSNLPSPPAPSRRLVPRAFAPLAIALVALCCACASTPAPSAGSRRLPASEVTAKDALDHSPRHGEYVDIPLASGGTPIRTWVMYPERPGKAGVVLVIHEVYGLSDWVRGVADQLAAEGMIAVVPNLISGLGPNGGGTESVPGRDDVVALVRKLTPDEARARLDAVRDFAARLPATNGRVATLGFCWGGGQSFSYATSAPPLAAAVVYYGVAPDSATLAEIRVPVLAFYGGDDARVTSTLEPARAALSGHGQSFESHVFAGAGHGFLRAQDDRNGANLTATRQAWPRTVVFLHRALR